MFIGYAMRGNGVCASTMLPTTNSGQQGGQKLGAPGIVNCPRSDPVSVLTSDPKYRYVSRNTVRHNVDL